MAAVYITVHSAWYTSTITLPSFIAGITGLNPRQNLRTLRFYGKLVRLFILSTTDNFGNDFDKAQTESISNRIKTFFSRRPTNGEQTRGLAIDNGSLPVSQALAPTNNAHGLIVDAFSALALLGMAQESPKVTDITVVYAKDFAKTIGHNYGTARDFIERVNNLTASEAAAQMPGKALVGQGLDTRTLSRVRVYQKANTKIYF